MSQRTIAEQAIFVERDGWVYYVTNWQKRFGEGGRAKLVRLSPRHFVRYNDLKSKGRSQKTIALLLFKRVPAKVTVAPPPSPGRAVTVRMEKNAPREDKNPGSRTVTIDIAMLTHEQVLALLQRVLRERLPGLRAMPLTELRRLYLAVVELRREAQAKD